MKRRLLYTILSISLLTVTAGAAIAPALVVSPLSSATHLSPYLIGVLEHGPALEPHPGEQGL